MATITTRSGKGSPLTNNEVDANFTNLNTDKAELSGATFTGQIVAPSLDISGNIDVDGVTNLDVVDIDGAVNMASVLQVDGTITTNGNLDITSAYPRINLTDSGANPDYSIINADGVFTLYDNTNGSNRFTINSSGAATFTGAITANAGVVVDNFTLDGTSLSLSTGNMKLDSVGRVTLDSENNGEVRFADSGADYLQFYESGTHTYIKSLLSDGDLKFLGNDGGVGITALTFDMSAAGAATFNNNVSIPNGNLTVGGADVNITGNIIHIGDGDTYFGFHGNDLWRVATGGVERFEVSNNGVIINDTGVDADFRVESSGNANMLFVDGGNDRVGIGMTPTKRFSVKSNGNSDIVAVEYSASAVEIVAMAEQNSHGAFFVRQNNGVTQHRITATNGVIFNDGGLDQDFRVESDANTHALFVDGGNNRVDTAVPLRVGFNEITLTSGTGIVQIATATSGTDTLWTDINDGVNSYSSMPSELAIMNSADNTTNSFAGIFFQAGETSSGSEVSSARIGAVRSGAFNTDLAFANRSSSGMLERFRIAADGSLSTPTAGTSNVRFGVNAGNSIASGGNYNTVVGDNAGTAITTGDENIAIGFNSLLTEDTGKFSVAIGVGALQTQNNDGNNYNTAVGHEAGKLVTTGIYNTLIGALAGDAITTASNNIAIGLNAAGATTTGASNIAIGTNSLLQNTTGQSNVSVGTYALNANTTASNNTAVGYQALTDNTTGTANVAVGKNALDVNTTGSTNTATGADSLGGNTTGGSNTAFGQAALEANTTASFNTGIGRNALALNTTGANNTAVGYASLLANTTGTEGVAVGTSALAANTTGNSNTAVGINALVTNTTGTQNVANGGYSLRYNTTGGANTAHGFQALQSNTTASNNTAVGYRAGNSITDGNGRNVFIGRDTGYAATGERNTFVGDFGGSAITSGSKNTIIGRYDGNSNGLDIRTSSNNIVLSDGDGNPRGIFDSSGNFLVGTTSTSSQMSVKASSVKHVADWQNFNDGGYGFNFKNASGSIVGTIAWGSSSTSYNTSSDHRLKENVVYEWDATTRLKQLKPARFNFIADADTTVDGFLAHEAQAVVPEAVTGTHNEVDDDGVAVMQGIDQSKLVPLLVKAIQEQQALIEALTARIETLEG